jgi:hypothetical protein
MELQVKYQDISESIVDKNILSHNGKEIVLAGQSIYYSMWSRDFLYSAPTLLKYPKWRNSVKDTVELIMDHMKRDSYLLPKGIDTIYPEWRSVRGTIRICFKLPRTKVKHKKTRKWKTIYKDHNRSEAVDTNLLLLITVMEMYNSYPEYKEFIKTKTDQLIKILRYYNVNKLINNSNGGLISQPGYSDWKDSTKRKGVTFLTNLIYWKALKDMEKSGLFANLPAHQTIKYELNKKFYNRDRKIYHSMLNSEQFGIEENLLALDWGFVTDPYIVYKGLRQTKQWSGTVSIPGIPISQKHKWYEKPLFIWLIGAQGYHDDFLWIWVTALASKVSYKLGYKLEAKRLEKIIKTTIEEHQTIYDAYKLNDADPVLEQARTRGFEAEHDWTWGASYVLEMYNIVNI